MKIQYIGFLPIILIYLGAHWQLIRFYRKYGTLDYFDSKVPSNDNPNSYVLIVLVLNSLICVLGICWALS